MAPGQETPPRPAAEPPANPVAAQDGAAPAAGKVRFVFQQQKWTAVLHWFARQGDMSLVMNDAPEGDFTYSDTKDYTPAEAIDLLNSVLASKGFTLVRRNKALIVVDIKNGFPYDMAPQVQLEELDKYGRYELVSVMFPLGKRPVETVAKEVDAVLGQLGRAAPLPGSSRLLVTEMAGKMRGIAILIEAIPEPKTKPKPKPPQPQKPPPPELRVYPSEGLNVDATIETLKGLIPGVTSLAISKRVKLARTGLLRSKRPSKPP